MFLYVWNKIIIHLLNATQIKWHVWVRLNYPRSRRTEIHSQIYANDFCLRTRHGKVSSSRNLHACLPRVYTSVREKKKRTLKKRSENRRVLSIRAHMYAESCGPSSPASAGFPRSFSRLDLSLPSLSLSLRFFSFSSSWGQNRDHASPSFPFFGVVHSLASPPHIFSRLRRSPAKFHDGFDLRYNATLLTVPTIAISKT